MKKRVGALLIVFCLLISAFSGCSVLKENTTRQANAVVARVGNETITRQDVATLFYTYYTSYGYSYYYTKDQVLEIVITSLINQKIVLNAAKEVVVLNNVDKNEILESVRKAIDSELNTKEKAIREKIGVEIPDRLKDEEEDKKTLFEEYKSVVLVPITFEEDTTTDIVSGFEIPTDPYRLLAYNEYIAELVQSAKINGKNTNKNVVFQSKLDDIYKYYEEQMYVNKYQEYVESRMIISDAEILSKFQTMINTARQTYLATSFEDVATDSKNKELILFYDYENTNDEDSGDLIDNGYIRVQHLLLQFSDEVKLALSKLAGHSITEQEYKYHAGTWTPETDAELNTAAGYLTTQEWNAYIAARASYLSEISTTYLDIETGETVKDEEENELTVTLAQIESIISEAMSSIDANAELSANEKNVAKAQEFKRLIYIYGSDPGMFNTGNISDTIGYTLPANSDKNSGYVGEFSEGVYDLLSTGIGSISDTVISDHGVHFIMILGKTIPGAICDVEINEMKNTLVSISSKQSIYEYIYGILLKEKQENYFSNHITTLRSENKDKVTQLLKTYKEILG